MSGVYSFAAVLYLQFEPHVMLFRQWNRFVIIIIIIIIIIIVIIIFYISQV